MTITEKVNCATEREEDVPWLFPEKSQRPFQIDKPTILMTARVHPGETPASHAVEGAIEFLTNPKDYRAYLLRKNFRILVVHMINPDGVYHGMFRYDMSGENLNRMYTSCSSSQQ